MPAITRKDLEKIVTILVDDLHQKGFLPTTLDKNKLIEGFIKNSAAWFNPSDLSDPLELSTFREKLVPELLQIALLNNALEALPLQEKQSARRSLLTFLFSKQSVLSEKELEELLTRIQEQRISPKEAEDQISQLLRNLYGGVDPRLVGSVATILTSLISNTTGIVDLGGSPSSTAVIDEDNRPDYQNPDTNGREHSLSDRLKTLGVLDQQTEAEYNKNLYTSPSPFNRRPTPFRGG